MMVNERVLLMFYKISGVILAISLIVSGCGMLPEEEGVLVPPIITPEEIPYRTIVIERQPIEDSVKVRGAIAPAEMENYFFDEKGGRIKAITYRVGDFVEVGDVMIELVVDNLPNTIEYQRLTVKNLQSAYTHTSAKQAIEMDLANRAISKQRENVAEMDLYPELYTAKELRDAKDQLADAELNLELTKMTHLNNLAQQANTLDIEKLRLVNYEATMEKSLIRATMPGVVTYVKRMFIGDLVTDFETLISVADINKVQIDYEGSLAHEFELGMEVEVVYANQTYVGHVVLTPDSVPVEERANFINKAIFEFEEVPVDYYMGDAIEVRATLSASENAIILPKDAIKTFGQDKLVYVLEEGEKRERYIRLGIDAGPYIEITEGLEEGDEVIIN